MYYWIRRRGSIAPPLLTIDENWTWRELYSHARRVRNYFECYVLHNGNWVPVL